ncbi:hypothetical protein C1645_813982 [Glomus cerebriforme]|uniref:Uncharacterized protein n=1 Tax=Glomus cerebriforme TaxID=658196 RepID=A0A397TR97_9GLOM|nr:hypothetical protein C1645_813982 [Glomus cerebriforme]
MITVSKSVMKDKVLNNESICNEGQTDTLLEYLTAVFTIHDMLSTLPNNKAAGPSTIKYEDIKHSDDTSKQFLLDYFNIIKDKNVMPSEWSEALLFPIPKPKEWNYDINNTTSFS